MLVRKTFQTKNFEKFINVIKKIIPDFKINKIREDFYKLLFLYFSKDEKYEECDSSYSLSKGLLIIGKIGNGKSTIMEIFKNNFKIIPARYIVREFHIEGMTILDKYGRHSFHHTAANACDYGKPITYCFDDLALEETDSKLYGNSANVMADILLDRHEMFQKFGLITHAITNLEVDDLKEIYGDRIRDRMKEMFNLIVFLDDSLRK